MKKLLLKCFISPGDIVMLTAAVRDLHVCYPNQYLTDVRTYCQPLWENNPYVTRLEEGQPDVEVIECDYPLIGRSNQEPYHFIHGFIQFLNDRLKLSIKPNAFKGDIHLSPLEKSWYSQVHELTGEDTPFWLIISGGKKDTTIKWWSPERYQKVVDHFRGRIQFVQVGESNHHHPRLEGVIDLRGKTDLRQLVRLVYHADGALCPVTALMHLAAAVETKPGNPRNRPCVVVAGGREPVHWEAYPHHQFIHTIGALPCCAHGGCWRARTVPLGDGDDRDKPESLCVDVVGDLPRCMDMITSAEVIRLIELYYQGRVLKYLSPEQARAAERGVALSRVTQTFDERVAVQSGVSSRAILIQQASGPHTAMLDLTSVWHNRYAARHGLTFWSVRGNLQLERAPHWDKIILIHRALMMGSELVVWLDADTLIVRPDVDLRAALPEGPPIGLCRHPIPFGDQPWHYNSGVIFVRNCELAREFFKSVWKFGPVNHPWHEQVGIIELSRQMTGSVQTLDDRWNSTAAVNPAAQPVIRSWHGRTVEECLAQMKAAVDVCQAGGSAGEPAHAPQANGIPPVPTEFKTRVQPDRITASAESASSIAIEAVADP
jgi:ADP-heptose:LPS heptosyltransferase